MSKFVHLFLPVLLFLLLCLLTPPQSALAADQVVTDCGDSGSANQLRAKITGAQNSGGGKITFTCGPATITLVNGVLPTITANLTIDGGGKITLSGNNGSRIFIVNAPATLTLNNITITKGHCDCDGGAIAVSNGGSLVIDSSAFRDNSTEDPWSGGAILSRGTLKISNSTFDHNSGGNGGALDPRDGSSSTDIRNTLFQNNYTTNTTNGWGGAVLIWDGAAVTVENSRFISNTANSGSFSSSTIDRGGAVYVRPNSGLTATNSQFAGNSAFFGGALYVDPGGSLTLTGGELHDNSIGIFDGTQGGGAIYNAGNLLVDSAQLHDNHADGGGGAIENWGDALVRNAVFRHNQAGGGAAIANDGNATILTSTLANNIAQLYGGAIDAADHTDVSKGMTITGSTLSGNQASLDGGAIESEMRLTLTNVTVSGNSGPQVIDHYERLLTLTNTTIAQNNGTGLSLHNNPPHLLRNSLLASNAGGNCSGSVGSGGFNLSSDGSCGFGPGHDNVNLLLGTLGNHGGFTQTSLPSLNPKSPAIDNGTPSSAPSTDQRGIHRPQGAADDVGAVEVCQTKPAKPILPKPKNGKSAKGPRVTLDWNDALCTQTYSVLIKLGSQTGSQVQKIRGLIDSTATTKALSKGQTYYWQVTAMGDAGKAKSDWWKFTVK